MPTKFFYMDEHYADPKTYHSGNSGSRRAATSLTGVTVPMNIHRDFRHRYYRYVAEASDKSDGTTPSLPLVHAAELLPGVDDERKFAFLEKVVSMVIEFRFSIYRVEYYETPQTINAFNGREGLISMCFASLLHCLREELRENELWPVMETNGQPSQDRAFAGHLQAIDYFTALVGQANVSVDNFNLGELLYNTKRSSYGSVTDIVSYLLDARASKLSGKNLSAFKTRLAVIAGGLVSAIAFDEVIELKFENPPSDYEPSGPLRYAMPILPT